MSGGAPGGLGIGGLLAATLRLAGDGFGRMFPAALGVSLISALAAEGLAPADPVPALGPGLLWAALADLLLGTLLTGFLCLVAIDVAIGRRHSTGQYLRQAARQFLPLLVFTFAVSIAIGIGFVFLVIPGLYAAARYLPYCATTVFEDAGWRGIERAEVLTRGYRWPLVGLLAVGFALLLAVGIPIGVLSAEFGPLTGLAAQVVLSALGYLVAAAFSAVVYLRLRDLREGVSASDLASSIG